MSQLLIAGLMARECSDFGGIFEIGANKMPCSMGTTGFGGRLTAGGFSPHAEVTITVRKEFLKGGLKVGNPGKVTDSCGQCREVKIAKDGIRDCIFAWEITLADANQNA